MKDKRKSTLKILDFLEQNMPIDEEEIERPTKPNPLTESDAGTNNLDKYFVKTSSKRRDPPPDDEDIKTPAPNTPIDPVVIPTPMGNRKKKRLIDNLLS